MQTKIIYEDKQVLVCHKPAGLAVQSAKVGQSDMVSELKKYLAGAVSQKGLAAGKAGAPYLGIVHRLDQPVEGLLVFAKTKEAAAKLTKQLEKGSLHKQYYALVCGQPKEETGTLVDYLLKEGNVARVVEATGKNPEAKKAVLQYQLVKTQQVTDFAVEGLTQNVVSLLDIRIETGRFHQIRVQMAHAGVPLLGDTKYGNEESLTLSRSLGVRNVALFAYKLDFMHPTTGKWLEYVIQPSFPTFLEI